jgi:predicted  nucleic acid-binding Zn-ribbon protein
LEEDVLSLLARLQGVADEIDRIEAKRRAATEARERVEGDLLGAEETLAQCRERLHNFDIERRKRELAVKAERDRMQRVKSRLGEVKTSREYQAVLAEISAAKQTVTENEEALTKDQEVLETTAKEIQDLEGKVHGIQGDLEVAAIDLETVLAETEQVMAQRKAEEAEVLKALPVSVVDRYRLIRTRRGGLAVVEARDEACTACFMRIPPQTYIEVIRRTKVIQCPNCHRILVPPSQPFEPASRALED